MKIFKFNTTTTHTKIPPVWRYGRIVPRWICQRKKSATLRLMHKTYTAFQWKHILMRDCSQVAGQLHCRQLCSAGPTAYSEVSPAHCTQSHTK